MADFDLDTLILSEHEAFRRAFTEIDALTDVGQLTQRWGDLAAQLEVHASAEEAIFYPELLHEVDDSEGDAKHAVGDHNDIREAVRACEQHEVGSDDWRTAFDNAREVTGDHLGEEERDVLPPFRESVSAERRGELGMTWLAFHEEHEDAKGLSGAEEDPDAFVEEHA